MEMDRESAYAFKPEIKRLWYCGHAATAIAMSDNATSIIAALDNTNIVMYFLDPEARGRTLLNAHAAAINCLCFNHEGTIFASGSSDNTVHVYEHHSHRADKSAKFGCVRFVEFNSDTYKIAAACDNCINLHPTPRLDQPQTFRGHGDLVRCVRFSPDDRMLLSGGDDETVMLWDVRMKQSVLDFSVFVGSNCRKVTATAYHPSSTIIAAGTQNDCFYIWDIRIKRLLQFNRGHNEHASVNGLTFSKCGRFLFNSATDGKIFLTDLAQCRHLSILDTIYVPINASNFTRCGNYYATSGKNNVIQMWDLGMHKVEMNVVDEAKPPTTSA